MPEPPLRLSLLQAAFQSGEASCPRANKGQSFLMSIRFAAPKASLRARTRPSSSSLAFPRPANDNASALTGQGVNDIAAAPDPLADTTLTAALRYFGEHGLAAAGLAHAEACRAFAHGDKAQFAWWREICGTLDRRLARDLPSKRDIAGSR